jgi:cytochrome c oxidase subunit 1
MTGRLMNETAGKIHFVLISIGMNLAFFPMHLLGLAGMPRRIATYSADTGWGPLNLAATIGAFLIAASVAIFFWNLFASLRAGQVAGDDLWDAKHGAAAAAVAEEPA